MAATEKEVRLTVDCGGTQRDLLWISLQRDGSISVGFISQQVIVSGFTSEREVDGAVQRESVDLTVTHRREALNDPHFTLHEGAYFRSRSGKHPPLLEGLVWTTPEPGKNASPWLRFTSNPIRALRVTRAVRRSFPVEVHRLITRSDERSIAVHVDFVRPDQRSIVLGGSKISHVIAWKGVTMSVVAHEVPAQPATLGYRIEG